MKENKIVELTDIDGKKVWAKNKERGNAYFVENKGDKYIVFKTRISKGEILGYGWHVFETKDKEKAIKVAKFLAGMEDE